MDESTRQLARHSFGKVEKKAVISNHQSMANNTRKEQVTHQITC